MSRQAIKPGKPAVLLTAGLSVILLFGACGCGSSHVVRYAGPTLTRADLGLPDGACELAGFASLETQASAGRFPAALAVARLKPAGDQDGSHRWQIMTLRHEEATYWNSLFNSTPAIREVFVLGEQSLPDPATDVREIVKAGRRLGASVCLIYGPSAAGPRDAALIGALLDARTGVHVSCIHALVTPAEFKTRAPDRPRGDLRHCDPDYLVARQFERQVHRCVLDLIAADTAPQATRQSPYRSAATQPFDKPVYIVPAQ